MGNGSCCRKYDRHETLMLDEENKNEPSSQTPKNSNQQVPQMISLSDSDEEYQSSRTKKHFQFGKFQDQKKGSQLSTGQIYSFQSLPSEQQFSNFVTFQALPSGHNIQQQQNGFTKLQQNFQQEMNEVAQFQQNSQKSQKRVHFAK